MPELYDPPGAAISISGVVEILQRQRGHIADEGRKLARHLHGAGGPLQAYWRQLCREVAAGRTEAVQAARESFLGLLQRRLTELRSVNELARLDGREPQDAEDLAGEITGLEKLYSKLTSRWQDVESLQYLAAEALTPPADKLDAMARKNGFPQAWYDQEGDPFQE